jgi:hypothetical protein
VEAGRLAAVAVAAGTVAAVAVAEAADAHTRLVSVRKGFFRFSAPRSSPPERSPGQTSQSVELFHGSAGRGIFYASAQPLDSLAGPPVFQPAVSERRDPVWAGGGLAMNYFSFKKLFSAGSG